MSVGPCVVCSEPVKGLARDWFVDGGVCHDRCYPPAETVVECVECGRPTTRIKDHPVGPMFRCSLGHDTVIASDEPEYSSSG